MKKFLFVAGAALALSVGATSVAAQQQPVLPLKCGPKAAMVVTLKGEKYQEVELAAGLSGDNLAVLWGNLETGTWTFTVEPVPGLLCLALVGQALELIPAEDGTAEESTAE